jgi:hypothetical protein
LSVNGGNFSDLPDDDTTDEGDDSGDEGDGGLTSGGVRGIIATMIASGVLTALSAWAGYARSIQTLIWSELRSVGSTIESELSTVGSVILDLVTLPIRVSGDIAASAGIFAPLIGPLIFAITAVVIWVILLALWRVVRFI